MLTALVTDIHANREALSAVLEDIAAVGADRIICLGDIVGYGADPQACVDVIAGLLDAGQIVLQGNHDAAISAGAAGMTENARLAIEWTRRQIDSASQRLLDGLKLTHREGECLYVHASARTPERWIYVESAEKAADSMADTDARMIFSGHTHMPALFHRVNDPRGDGKVSTFRPAEPTPVPLSSIRRYHAVIGSVGQPRDSNPAACWGLLNETTWQLSWRRVPYDLETAMRKIKDAGLPSRLWMRLLEGR